MKKVNLGARFRILERDNFSCRYCGRSAPEVALEVDHIVPRSKGGKDVATNLITACLECNRGKSHGEIKPIKAPEHIELPKGSSLVAYRPISFRLSEKTWETLRTERLKSRTSWNRFIAHKLNEYEKTKSELPN